MIGTYHRKTLVIGIGICIVFVSQSQSIFSPASSVNIHVESEGNSTTTLKQKSTTVQSSSTEGSSHSDVVIEQNGQVKRFQSNGEDINFVSEDGTVSVDVSHDEDADVIWTEKEETEETTDVKKEIKWIEKETKEVLGEHVEEAKAETKIHETFIKPSDILKSVVTTIPNPLTQVERMVSLIQSAVNLF